VLGLRNLRSGRVGICERSWINSHEVEGQSSISTTTTTTNSATTANTNRNSVNNNSNKNDKHNRKGGGNDDEQQHPLTTLLQLQRSRGVGEARFARIMNRFIDLSQFHHNRNVVCVRAWNSSTAPNNTGSSSSSSAYNFPACIFTTASLDGKVLQWDLRELLGAM
jgi:hypothetical protein